MYVEVIMEGVVTDEFGERRKSREEIRKYNHVVINKCNDKW